jgi:hypothetical protein
MLFSGDSEFGMSVWQLGELLLVLVGCLIGRGGHIAAASESVVGTRLLIGVVYAA